MPTPTQLRSGVASLATLAARDLEAMWRQVTTAVQARDALRDILPGLINLYGDAAAALAADWYDDLRDDLRVSGSFRAFPAELLDSGADELARWGVDPLFSANPNWASAATLVAGGLQRRIANAARRTITDSSVADPFAKGWQRTGHGSCDFCRLLIGRGAVYTEATADFASHDHCNCGAAPAFQGFSLPVKPYEPGPRDRTKSGGKDYARALEYIESH